MVLWVRIQSVHAAWYLIVQLNRVLIIASLVCTILRLYVHVPVSLTLLATELDHRNPMEALPKPSSSLLSSSSSSRYHHCRCHLILRGISHCLELNIPQTKYPLGSLWNYISNEYLCIQIRFRMKELCPFYLSTAFCPDFNSARAAFNDLHIAPCRNIRIEWFLLRWKEDFMGFPNIRKYSILSSWGWAPCWWHFQPPVFCSADVDNLQPLHLGLVEIVPPWLSIHNSKMVHLYHRLLYPLMIIISILASKSWLKLWVHHCWP